MRSLICPVEVLGGDAEVVPLKQKLGTHPAFAGLELEWVSRKMLLAAAGQLASNTLLPIVLYVGANLSIETVVALLKALRRGSCHAPLIVVMAPDTAPMPAILLDSGADDVIFMPQGAAELPARLRAITRRMHQRAEAELQCGALQFAPDGSAVLLNDRALQLSPREYDILRHLTLNQGRIIAKSTLYDALYALSPVPPLDKIIDVYICRRRSKLKQSADAQMAAPQIETIKGRGYRIV